MIFISQILPHDDCPLNLFYSSPLYAVFHSVIVLYIKIPSFMLLRSKTTLEIISDP